MPSEKAPRPAYVVDVDENGKQVRGTVRSALKEKPKVSQHEVRSSKTRKPHSDTGDKSKEYSQALQIVTEKETKLERRKSSGGHQISPRKSATRPPLSHENRTSTRTSVPKRSSRDMTPNYALPPPDAYAPPVALHGYAPPPMSTMPPPMQIPHRPRPVSTQTLPLQPTHYNPAYNSGGNHGPPLSNSAYYPHAPMNASTFVPASPNSSYMSYAMTPQGGSTQQDYFAHQMSQPPPRPLSARFDSIPRTHTFDRLADPVTRTTSAFGTRETRRPSMDGQFGEGYYEDSYASRISDGAVRKTIREPMVRRKEHEDTRAMPPPPLPLARPSNMRRPVTEYQAEYSEDDHDEYHDRKERSHRREQIRPRRPSANRHSVSYDLGKDSEPVRIETANNGRRRQSYYGQSASIGSGSGYEDKLSSAANYQTAVGGPTVPLTAEVLKRQQRRQQEGSSRSASSRDESDYKKSQTTRTTRSGSGNGNGNDDENVTIRVVGQARVVVGGAQIDCNDGGEISISRQKSIRSSSERGSEFGGQKQIDDRRSRVERPPGRSRVSSTSSYTRSSPKYPVESYL